MKNWFYIFLVLAVSTIATSSCKKDDEIVLSPNVPFSIEINDSVFFNGDSLHGRIVVNESSLVKGMDVKKIDCRLDNVVIGSVKNEMMCPFGVRLVDKPVGVHTFSVIIKCEAPDCEETFWRHNYKMITIKEKEL